MYEKNKMALLSRQVSTVLTLVNTSPSFEWPTHSSMTTQKTYFSITQRHSFKPQGDLGDFMLELLNSHFSQLIGSLISRLYEWLSIVVCRSRDLQKVERWRLCRWTQACQTQALDACKHTLGKRAIACRLFIHGCYARSRCLYLFIDLHVNLNQRSHRGDSRAHSHG